MSKINYFYFIDNEDLSVFLKRPKSFRRILLSSSKLFSECVIVNISKIIDEDLKKNNFEKILGKDNINYFCPTNSKEFNNRINKEDKNYGLFKANFDLKYFKILRILKKSILD